MQEIEDLMSQVSLPANAQTGAYGGYQGNILGDVTSVLEDIEAQSDPLAKLESSLDSVLNPNSESTVNTRIKRWN
jgi:hypothetical protein